MTREESILKLKNLKEANLPKVTAEYVLKDLSRYTREQIEDLNEYFSQFVITKDRKCIWCDKPLYASWGLRHGSGYCEECGLEVVFYHYPKFRDGTKHCRIEAGYQYHPDCFSIDDEDSE